MLFGPLRLIRRTEIGTEKECLHLSCPHLCMRVHELQFRDGVGRKSVPMT